jgi:hypothetical protein
MDGTGCLRIELHSGEEAPPAVHGGTWFRRTLSAAHHVMNLDLTRA